jgi:hypothetical protein
LPTSTGEFHIIRDRERIQYKYMKEKDHFTQTQLPALIAALAAAAMAIRLQLLQLFTFSLGLSTALTISLKLCSLLVPIYRHEWCHQLQLFFNNGGCQPLTLGWVHMVGAAPAAVFVNGWCCPLMVAAH